MNRHPVSFDDLADWVDERLGEQRAASVRAHLATGCPRCRTDLVWLRRVLEAAKGDQMVDPPLDAVVRAKELYRRRSPVKSGRGFVLPAVRRWAPAIGMVIVLLVAAMYLSQTPTLLASQASLSGLQGTAELLGIGEQAWQVVHEGAVVGEGDLLRISEAPAVLTLFEGTRMVLQPGVQMEFGMLRSGLFGHSYHIALQQESGSVEYDVAPLPSARCRFEAQTATVRVSVQGTRFVIQVETEEETRVTVLQGSVRLESAEESAVLLEREAAIVPASAPLVRLPTLTPTFTPVPLASQTKSLSLQASNTAPETHTPTSAAEKTAPAAPVVATPEVVPTMAPTATAAMAVTKTETVTPVLETPTPDALLTLGPDRVEFTGVIEDFPPHILGRWRIGGRDVIVRLTTRIRGTPAVGLRARVVCLVPAASIRAERTPVAAEIDIAEPEAGPGPRPTATPWWDAITTVLPPPVQTILPQLPTLPGPTLPTVPDLLGTMVAWPTEHPIQLPWPSRTPRAQATTAATPEASATSDYD